MKIKRNLEDKCKQVKNFIEDIAWWLEDAITMRSAMNFLRTVAVVYLISKVGESSIYIFKALSVLALYIIYQYTEQPEDRQNRACDLFYQGSKDEVIPLRAASMLLLLKLERKGKVLPRNESTHQELSKIILSELNCIYKKQEVASLELKKIDIDALYIQANDLQKAIECITQNKKLLIDENKA